jgi:hypothetical protein
MHDIAARFVVFFLRHVVGTITPRTLAFLWVSFSDKCLKKRYPRLDTRSRGRSRK